MKKILAGVLCAALLCLSFGMLAHGQETKRKFVVLGDSIAEGNSAILPCNRYADRVARANGYELRNFGKGGDTSWSLLQKVREDEPIRQAVREADVIAVSIGGNDFYPSMYLVLNGLLGELGWVKPRAESLRKNFAGAIAEIRRLNPGAVLVVQTLYNPVFAFMPPSAHELYGAIVREINAAILGYLDKHPGAYLVADVNAAFAQRYGMVFADMVHPSPAGHAVIAAVLLDTINGTNELRPCPLDAVIGVPVRLSAPALALADRGLAGTLQTVHDRMPRVWEYITR